MYTYINIFIIVKFICGPHLFYYISILFVTDNIVVSETPQPPKIPGTVGAQFQLSLYQSNTTW